MAEAFRWSASRKVSRTATVSLEGNTYAVDPALVARRVELRYDPEDLSAIDVFFEGRPAGVATPFVIGRHTHRAVPQAKRPEPTPTGVDYLGMVAAAHEEQATASGPHRLLRELGAMLRPRVPDDADAKRLATVDNDIEGSS